MGKCLTDTRFYICVILIGIIFRFYHLDYKFFWHDEVITTITAAGNTQVELESAYFQDGLRDIAYFDQFTQIRGSDKEFPEQITDIFTHPQLTPLHYALLAGWVHIVGDSNWGLRLFSVLVSLLVFPVLFLLGKELTGSEQGGWIAMVLYAVSPYFVANAQEARYYMLWGFTAIVSHLLVLYALRKQQIWLWVGYAATITLALYISLLSALLIVMHGTFILLLHRDALWKYSGFTVLGLLLYAPYGLFIATHFTSIVGGLGWQTLYFPPIWERIVNPFMDSIRVFYHYFGGFEYHVLPHSPVLFGGSYVVAAGIGILILYACYYLLTHIRKYERSFLVIMLLVSVGFFGVYDVIINGFTILVSRYQVLTYVGLLLIITVWFSRTLANHTWVQWTFLGVILAGVFSLVVYSQAINWETKVRGRGYLESIQEIERAPQPVILSDLQGAWLDYENVGYLLTLTHSLDHESADILIIENTKKTLQQYRKELEGYTHVFVFTPSQSTLKILEQYFGKTNLKKVVQEERIISLWQIELEGTEV